MKRQARFEHVAVSRSDASRPRNVRAGHDAFGARVARTEEFAPAFEAAIAARQAAIIELKMDPEMITTRTTLSAIRREALARPEQAEP